MNVLEPSFEVRPDLFETKIIKPALRPKLFEALLYLSIGAGLLALSLSIWTGLLGALSGKAIIAGIISPLAGLFCVFGGLVFFAPKEGWIILDENGFIVHSFSPGRQHHYNWDQVAGFYVNTFITRAKYNEVKNTWACFDIVGITTEKRRKVLSIFKYDLSPQELVDTLNQWKEKYSPNLEVETFTPLIDALSNTPKRSLLKEYGIYILVISSVGILLYFYFCYCATVRIHVLNNTRTTINDLRLFTESSLTHEIKGFRIVQLKSGEEAAVSIPYIEMGAVLLDYVNPRYTCVKLTRDICPWRSNDNIFIEPDQKIASNQRICNRDKIRRIDQILINPCEGTHNRQELYAQLPLTSVKLKTIKSSRIKAFRSLKPPETTDEYINAITASIKSHWHPVRNILPGTPTITFKVHRDGSFFDIRILKGSGQPDLDQSALEAVKAANPYFPIPAALKGTFVTVEFNFDYRLNQEPD